MVTVVKNKKQNKPAEFSDRLKGTKKSELKEHLVTERRISKVRWVPSF